MRDKLISFFSGYFLIPAVFYAFDMGLQSVLMTDKFWEFLSLTVVLVTVNGVIFWKLLAQRFYPVRSPWALAAGAIIGLWHFFVPYLLIGTYWVWKTVPQDGSGMTVEDIQYLAAGFVDPSLNLYQWQCDGSLPAVLISAVLFCGMILKPKLGKIKK